MYICINLRTHTHVEGTHCEATFSLSYTHIILRLVCILFPHFPLSPFSCCCERHWSHILSYGEISLSFLHVLSLSVFISMCPHIYTQCKRSISLQTVTCVCCVCVCVCICVCMYTCIYEHTYTHAHTHSRTHTHIHTRACVQKYTHSYTRSHTHTHANTTQIHTQTHAPLFKRLWWR